MTDTMVGEAGSEGVGRSVPFPEGDPALAVHERFEAGIDLSPRPQEVMHGFGPPAKLMDRHIWVHAISPQPGRPDCRARPRTVRGSLPTGTCTGRHRRSRWPASRDP